MTKIFSKIAVSLALTMFIFGVFGYASSTNLFIHQAHAVVGGSGGCGGCGGGTTGGGGGGGGNTPPPPVCNISIDKLEVTKIGESYTVTWSGTPSSATFFINGAQVPNSGSSVQKFIGPNYDRYNLVGNNGGVECQKEVRITMHVTQLPSCDAFTASPTNLPIGGGNVTLNWATTNATNATIDGQAVAGSGSLVKNVTSSHTFTLSLTNSIGTVSCNASVTVPPPAQPPSCDSFTASPTVLPYGGGSVNLVWQTSNADSVSIDHGVGTVSADGSKSVNVTNSTTYTLTVHKTGYADVTCPASVTVKPQQQQGPSCDSFTASPSSLPNGGGSVNLVWQTSNADSVSINNGIGAVSADGSRSVSVTQSTNFVLTAKKVGYADVTCPAPVTVNPPNTSSFSCENNVTFTADKTALPYPGGTVNLTWNTTGADTVSILGLGNNLTLSGTQNDLVHSSKTYTLVATHSGQSISCPLTVSVGGDGGGGGVQWPYCQLRASVTQVQPGQNVQLTWTSRLADTVTLGDDHGNIIFDTPDTSKFNGSLTVQPTQTTTYTFVAHRGSIDLPCLVTVHVPNVPVTVLQSRSQQPIVAGISLTQVPYTGFDAGPLLTFIFYALLTIWGLFVVYVFVIRRKGIAGLSFAGAHIHVPYVDASVEASSTAESSIAEGYVYEVAEATVPHNLPTATVAAPVIGYAAQQAMITTTAPQIDTLVTPMQPEEVDESIAMTGLENRAHGAHALLSSDAMRYFMNVTKEADRIDVLDMTIRTAKETFPSEDGWIVLNLARMESLLTDQTGADDETMTETAPITSGSLAEAIVAGNIVAAYEMIASRPMIALADASADLDAVYRARKGATVSVSELLKRETAGKTDAQLHDAIAALTSAIDGTYTSEAEAVKMAILKAVKALN